MTNCSVTGWPSVKKGRLSDSVELNFFKLAAIQTPCNRMSGVWMGGGIYWWKIIIFADSLIVVEHVWEIKHRNRLKKGVNITVTHHHYIIKVISWLVGWLLQYTASMFLWILDRDVWIHTAGVVASQQLAMWSCLTGPRRFTQDANTKGWEAVLSVWVAKWSSIPNETVINQT